MKKKKLKKQLKKQTVKNENFADCLVSIYDTIMLYESDSLDLSDGETLSQMFFRKMKAYRIDLNKEKGWTHLKPRTRKELDRILKGRS